MKPYYEQDGITVYHGDCMEILPTIAADVLVTDPPYGVDFHGKNTKHTKRMTGGYISKDDAAIGPASVVLALEIVKRAAVFCGTRNMARYPPPRDVGCVYCPSGAGIGTWGFTLFHPILFYGPRPSSVLRPTSIQSFAISDATGHPCPKPMEWLHWLVCLSSLPGETVLDPFCGSGTTLRASKDNERRAIGIECEERYCEIAVKRLAQRVLFRAEEHATVSQ